MKRTDGKGCNYFYPGDPVEFKLLGQTHKGIAQGTFTHPTHARTNPVKHIIPVLVNSELVFVECHKIKMQANLLGLRVKVGAGVGVNAVIGTLTAVRPNTSIVTLDNGVRRQVDHDQVKFLGDNNE